MKQFVTRGIVLHRVDYGEADRILTLLTPDCGKISLLARGVRRVKSKLAGGIELFSVSQITFGKGRSDLGTLMSSRLERHFGQIVADLNRTMLGYDLIKRLDKMTEDELEPEYFTILEQTFAALDDPSVGLPIIEVWFGVKMLQLSGHLPDLHHDARGQQLAANMYYLFDSESMRFSVSPDNGQYGANHIKVLRLAVQAQSPLVMNKIQQCEQLCKTLRPLIQNIQHDVGLST